MKEGDEIVHINGTSLENMSLKEAKKVVESAKDKLDLKIKRSILPKLSSAGILATKETNLNKMESTQPPIRPPLPSGMFFVYFSVFVIVCLQTILVLCLLLRLLCMSPIYYYRQRAQCFW